MLKSIKIRNFRCFKEFNLPQLGRVNLIVGKNNSGKTSILEAVHILNSPDSIQSFLDIIESRRAYSQSTNDTREFALEAIHFLYGHQLKAIKERILDPQHPEAQMFVNWFRKLYQL